MSERINIAAMAETVSNDMFGKIGWSIVGPPNESWVCSEPALHEVKDHPTDVTFVYDDPYTRRTVHLLTDLKSYAAGSIQDYPLKNAIESLASAVQCAKTNPSWKELYLQEGNEPEIQGLLFIYNHDSEYDKNFAAQLKRIFEQDMVIPNGVKLYIMGPDDIWYLGEILNDIANLSRNEEINQDKNALSFYYHSDSRERIASNQKGSLATIDVLKGKYQILRYVGSGKKGGEKDQGVLIYYRGPCKESKEFILLIDMLRSFGLLDIADVIKIRCPRAESKASVNFQKAIKVYSDHPGDRILEKLKKIEYSSIASVRPNLTRFEVAMKGL